MAGIDLDRIIERIEREEKEGQPSPSGLLYNPFPVTGLSGSGDERAIPPVEPGITDQVQEFLTSAIRSSQFVGMTVVGDFGFGKTHLLRWIEYVINSSTAKARGQVVRAYYVSNPGIRPMDVLMAVTRVIGEEEFRKMIWSIIASDLEERFEGSGVPGLRSALGDDTPQSSLFGVPEESWRNLADPESLANLGTFLVRYRDTYLPPRKLREYAIRTLATVAQNRIVTNALVSMLLDDDAQAFSSWTSLTSSETQRRLGVPQQDYFRSIVGIVRKNGIGSIFLLIDEFEDVVGVRLSVRERAEYLATLRLLFDDRPEGLAAVVAMTPRAWEVTKETYPAFPDRFRSEIQLGPLNQVRAELMVKRYLGLARSGGDQERSDSLVPFTAAAIATLVKLANGNVRAFLSACYRVLQELWGNSIIDAAEIRTVLRA